jgi:hypothetical protein
MEIDDMQKATYAQDAKTIQKLNHLVQQWQDQQKDNLIVTMLDWNLTVEENKGAIECLKFQHLSEFYYSRQAKTLQLIWNHIMQIQDEDELSDWILDFIQQENVPMPNLFTSFIVSIPDKFWAKLLPATKSQVAKYWQVKKIV